MPLKGYRHSEETKAKISSGNTIPLDTRFWSKVDKESGPIYKNLGRCWIWTASITSGYGCIGPGSDGEQLAHRVSWVLNIGQIPEGLYVLHRCDNPKCVNPDHLFLGTQKNNIQDMVEKGRSLKGRPSPLKGRANPAVAGENHPSAKLSEKDVLEIRRLSTLGTMSYRQIASMFEVSSKIVSEIVRRRKWRHLT